MRLATIALPLMAMLSAFTASCGKDAPETLIRLIVDSDLEVGAELTRLEVRIFDRAGNDELRRQDFVLGEKREGTRYALPLSIKLAPDSQRSSADFLVVVTGIGPIGEDGSEVEVVEQQALTSFRPGETLRLDIFLARSCLFKLCRADGTAPSRLTCNAQTASCDDVPAREDLPVVTGDGVREYEEAKGDAETVGAAAGDGGSGDSDSQVGEATGVDASILDVTQASPSDASTADEPARLSDASIAEAGGVDVCTPNPCLNGGTCSQTGTRCACAPGFAGANCETNVCQPDPCGTGGTCAPSGSSYSCTCATGYVGTGTQRCDVGFVKVASSSSALNMCAVLSDGRIACWGDNSARLLFRDDRKLIPSPVVVATGTNRSELAVGTGFVCSFGAPSITACWGSNALGQLGNGSTQDSSTPVRVSQDFDPIRVGAGSGSVCSVLTNRTVSCWGKNWLVGTVPSQSSELVLTPRVVPDLQDVVDISVGSQHACAVRLNASPVCWGAAEYGELGNGSRTHSYVPTAVLGLKAPSTTVQIAVGNSFSCALNANGTVECWGRNDYGALGNGTQTPSTMPVAVRNLTDAISIAASSYHACALRANGQVVCWGSNYHGKLGDGTLQDSSLPVAVQNLTNVDAITCSGNASCAHLRSGHIYCWGDDRFAEVGNQRAFGNGLAVPVPVPIDPLR